MAELKKMQAKVNGYGDDEMARLKQFMEMDLVSDKNGFTVFNTFFTRFLYVFYLCLTVFYTFLIRF